MGSIARIRRLLVAAAVIAHLASPVAQEPRPGTATPIGVVSGRVVDADSGDPVRGARVTVVGEGRALVTALTDSRGEFELKPSGTGEATVRVSKAGFARASVRAPQAVRAREPQPLTVSLTPAGALAGSVRETSGNPAVGRRVNVWRLTADGGRSAAPVGTTETDDRGEYRVGGLRPGQYAVRIAGGFGSAGAGGSFSIVGSVVAEANVLDASSLAEAFRRAEEALADGDVFAEVRSGETAALSHDPVDRDRAVTMVVDGQASGARSTFTVTHVGTPDVAKASGVVTGYVLDEYGDPVEGAVVELRPVTPGPARKTIGSGIATRLTDDTGRYRLFGVPPDTYYLAVMPPADAPAPATASASGRTVRSPDGSILMMRPPAGSAPPPLHAPVFYPGGNLPGALPLIVRAGEELAGLSLTLSFVRGVRLQGRAFDSTGRRLTGTVSLIANLPVGVFSVAGMEAPIGTDGAFELANVPPGDYFLEAVGKAASGDRELGVDPITVGSSEPGQLTIFTSKGSRVTGRLLATGRGPFRSSLGLNVAPADPAYAAMLSVYSGGFVNPDGTFEITGLVGPGRFALEGAPEGWRLESVTVDGRDVTDDAVVFGARDYADVEVLISDGSGRIEGRVLIDPDTALPSFEQARRDLGLPPQSPDGVRSPYAVVVFPVDSGRWFYRSRYLRLGSSLLDGRFRMSGLPPGEYWVAAVRTRFMENAYGAWQDAEFFTGLLPNAQRVRIADGEAIEVEIRPAPDVR